MTKTSRPTLLVGSVNLNNAEEVLSTAGTILGDSLRAIPDGETGVRLGWWAWQEDVFKRAPFLERKGADKGGVFEAGYDLFVGFSAKGDLADARFDKLGYADAAIESYQLFKALRDKGTIPEGVRFQVSLPTPIAPLAAMLEPDDYLKIEPIYDAAMREEIRQICEAIPAEDLAIQWDAAMEIGVLEGLPLPGGKNIFHDPMNDMASRVIKVIGWVPQGVAAGLHLCYGDHEHKHWKEPKDTRVMVDLANAIFAGATRTIDWIHLPVPRSRDDDAYFAPLEELKLPSETQLYLGLVHHTDGLEGGKRRMAAATRYAPEFGVATECGLGRRPPETIPDVMKLMATLASR